MDYIKHDDSKKIFFQIESEFEKFKKFNTTDNEAFYIKITKESKDYIMRVEEFEFLSNSIIGWVLMRKMKKEYILSELQKNSSLRLEKDERHSTIFQLSWIYMSISTRSTKIELISSSQNNNKSQELLKDFKLTESLPELEAEDLYFRKIFGDRIVTYGDGGWILYLVPLYIEEELPLPLENRRKLVDLLSELGENRNDWNLRAPVMDIIDPDIWPNYNFKFNLEQIIYDDTLKTASLIKNLSNENSKFSLRSQYAWYPTDITVLEGGKTARISGPFRHLRLKGNTELYKHLMEVFLLMIPGFRKLNLINDHGDTTLQVVLKCQKYLIQPGQTYSGHWHVEGKTENIIAAGVYYPHIDLGIESDKLCFTHLKGPSNEYDSRKYVQSVYNVKVQEGTAIVFGNILPHKFLPLSNTGETAVSRYIINFFIIDPAKPLESTTNIWADRRMEILLNSFKRIGKGAREVLKSLLLKNYSVEQPSLEQLKLKRQKVRDELMNDRSGWGYIHYGNCGEVQYFDNFHQTKLLVKDKYESIHDEYFQDQIDY
jgi:hypothetical protein